MQRLGVQCSGGPIRYSIRWSRRIASFASTAAKTATLQPSFSSREVLTDKHNRFHGYLRISLTERCNLRCVYCMPEDGVSLTPNDKLLTLAERKRLIDVFAGLGVTKLRFTGGEPTVSKQLVELVQHARDIGTIKSIGITTNGLNLKNRFALNSAAARFMGADGDQQTLLDALIASGMTNVNISLDTLDEDKFATITRRDKGGLARTLSAIYYAASKLSTSSSSGDSNLRSVKVNCVLMRGINDCEVAAFVGLARELPIDVRFIELMPFSGNRWEREKFVPYTEVVEGLENAHGIQLAKWLPFEGGSSSSSVRHDVDSSDTTKWYSLRGGAGRVGFITSMTSHFCSSCNR